jgi:hypothetical protein
MTTGPCRPPATSVSPGCSVDGRLQRARPRRNVDGDCGSGGDGGDQRSDGRARAGDAWDPPGPGASTSPGVKENRSAPHRMDDRPVMAIVRPDFRGATRTRTQTDRSTARLRRAGRRCVTCGLGGGGRRRSGPPDAVLVVGADGLGISRRPALLRDQRPLHSPPRGEGARGRPIDGAAVAGVLPPALLATPSALPRRPRVGGRPALRHPRRAARELARGARRGFPGPHALPRHVRGSEPAGLDAGARGAILSRVSRGLDPLRTPRRLAWARGRHGDDHALPRQLELRMDAAGARRRRVGVFLARWFEWALGR